MTPAEIESARAEGFIVHDERRMHLPELSDVCVTCLQAEVANLREEISKYEGDY